MNERTKKLHDSLEALANSLIVDADELDAFAERWRAGFHQYSFYNQVLIAAQKPGATLCAGYVTWQKHGRQVRCGEHGLEIFVPFFSRKWEENEDGTKTKARRRLLGFGVGKTFDVSQTDGEPLNLGNVRVTGTSEVSLEDIIKAFPEYDWKIGNGAADGWTDDKVISISERANPGQMITTAFHELAHHECGHRNGRKDLSRTDKEIEAEATSYLVARCLGLENEDSRLYIVNWTGTKDKLEKDAGTKVLDAAQAILKRLKPEKEVEE